MSVDDAREHWVPGHVRNYLEGHGFRLPLEDMEPYYRDTDAFGRVYEVHRRSMMPAMRVCRELGSLLLDEKAQVVCDDQRATEFLDRCFAGCGFTSRAQEAVMRAFGLGTGAFSV